jgi:hypothetical protein
LFEQKFILFIKKGRSITYGQIEVAKIAQNDNWSNLNDRSFCRVTHLTLKHCSSPTTTNYLTHFEFNVTNGQSLWSRELIEYVRIVDETYEFHKHSASLNKCICVMQSGECKRNYVAPFCVVYTCFRHVNMDSFKCNVRDAIRNVRLQLNEPQKTLAKFDEYKCVYKAICVYDQ